MSDSTFFLKSLPFFKGLSDVDMDYLVQSACTKTYPKKSSVFIQGDTANRFFVVMSGWVKLYQLTSEGAESVLALFTRGDTFGEALLFDSSSYPYNAATVQTAKIIEIPIKVLKDCTERNLDFSLRLMKTMSHHIQRLQLENEHLSVMTTTQRVGCFLMQMCLGMEICAGHLKFPYDKHLAAARLGMQPETFSRALKDLQKIGVQIVKNDIMIQDHNALEEFCCSHCSCSSENCLLAKKVLCTKYSPPVCESAL